MKNTQNGKNEKDFRLHARVVFLLLLLFAFARGSSAFAATLSGAIDVDGSGNRYDAIDNFTATLKVNPNGAVTFDLDTNNTFAGSISTDKGTIIKNGVGTFDYNVGSAPNGFVGGKPHLLINNGEFKLTTLRSDAKSYPASLTIAGSDNHQATFTLDLSGSGVSRDFVVEQISGKGIFKSTNVANTLRVDAHVESSFEGSLEGTMGRLYKSGSSVLSLEKSSADVGNIPLRIENGTVALKRNYLGSIMVNGKTVADTKNGGYAMEPATLAIEGVIRTGAVAFDTNATLDITTSDSLLNCSTLALSGDIRVLIPSGIFVKTYIIKTSTPLASEIAHFKTPSGYTLSADQTGLFIVEPTPSITITPRSQDVLVGRFSNATATVTGTIQEGVTRSGYQVTSRDIIQWTVTQGYEAQVYSLRNVSGDVVTVDRLNRTIQTRTNQTLTVFFKEGALTSPPVVLTATIRYVPDVESRCGFNLTLEEAREISNPNLPASTLNAIRITAGLAADVVNVGTVLASGTVSDNPTKIAVDNALYQNGVKASDLCSALQFEFPVTAGGAVAMNLAMPIYSTAADGTTPMPNVDTLAQFREKYTVKKIFVDGSGYVLTLYPFELSELYPELFVYNAVKKEIVLNAYAVVVDDEAPDPKTTPGLVKKGPFGILRRDFETWTTAPRTVLYLYDGYKDGVARDPWIVQTRASSGGNTPGPSGGSSSGGCSSTQSAPLWMLAALLPLAYAMKKRADR